MFVLKKFFILYPRDYFPVAKNSKEGSLNVFKRYIKFHFSNFQHGLSPDQENVYWYFFTENLRLAAS